MCVRYVSALVIAFTVEEDSDNTSDYLLVWFTIKSTTDALDHIREPSFQLGEDGQADQQGSRSYRG